MVMNNLSKQRVMMLMEWVPDLKKIFWFNALFEKGEQNTLVFNQKNNNEVYIHKDAVDTWRFPRLPGIPLTKIIKVKKRLDEFIVMITLRVFTKIFIFLE